MCATVVRRAAHFFGAMTTSSSDASTRPANPCGSFCPTGSRTQAASSAPVLTRSSRVWLHVVETCHRTSGHVLPSTSIGSTSTSSLSAWATPRVRLPAVPGVDDAVSRSSAAAASMRRDVSRARTPASVSANGRRRRSTRWTPIACSSLCTRRVTADCVRWRIRAAAPTAPASATDTNARISSICALSMFSMPIIR